MAGAGSPSAGSRGEVTPPYFSVKEAVFPFAKFPGVDTILGPEMKSTGEVMGVGATFGEAFVKSQLAAGVRLPKGGRVHQRARRRQARAVEVARTLRRARLHLLATRGTAAALAAAGVAARRSTRWPRAARTSST
jgi:carbamoyl-phosphate synthase large subunit